MTQPRTLQHDTADITLRVPAVNGSLPLVRTVAASVAASMGLPLDVVEDLRLMASELMNLCIGASPRVTVQFEFSESAAGVRLTCRVPDATQLPDPTSFSVMVIEELAESFRATVDTTDMTLVIETAATA